MDQHCEKHEFAIGQQGTQITDLYGKLGLLATLPGKVDTQTEVLKELVVGMQSLSDHKAQIAVLCEIVSDYKLHKTEYLEFKKDYSEFKIRANLVDPDQVDDDHDVVIKMDAEWKLVKYVIPTVSAGAGAALGLFLDYLKTKIGG